MKELAMSPLGQSIISCFEVKSFSSSKFIWRHEESWEDTEKLLFLENTKKPAVNLLKNYVHLQHRQARNTPPRQTFDARWILQTTDFSPTLYGWAELRLAGDNFTRAELIVGGGVSEFDQETFTEAVAYLLTAVILNFRADLLSLHPLVRVGEFWENLVGPYSERQRVTTLLDSLAMDYEHVVACSNRVDGHAEELIVDAGFRTQEFFEVDSQSWLASGWGERLGKELSYIQKRAENQHALEESGRRRSYRRGGLIRRLFRW